MKKRIGLILAIIMLAAAVMPCTAFARDEQKNTDPDKYYVLLDCNNQFVTVYEKDDNGEYTRIVRRMICTTGRTELDPEDPEDKGTPTPAGIWKSGSRERFGKFAAFSGEYARYWTQIVDGVYFHSIMFGKRDINNLKSSAFGRLGNKGSHGCVRLYVEDAKWLYYNVCPGTTIEVSNNEKSNRGVTQALKTKMSFSEYNEFQKKIYDEPELENLKAWVTVDGASLRTGNGSNDRVIRKLSEGAEITVLQEGDPWIKAEIDGKEGYVKRAYVTYEKGVMQSTKDGKIMKTTAYMFAEPDVESEKLTKVPHDTSLIILEEDNGSGFTKIQYYTEIGYIQSRYIKTDWATIYDTTEVAK